MEELTDSICGKFEIRRESKEKVQNQEFTLKIGYSPELIKEGISTDSAQIEKCILEGMQALREIISKYGTFPYYYAPLTELFILFHKSLGKPMMKVSRPKGENSIGVVINLVKGDNAGTSEIKEFKSAFTHELLHTIAQFQVKEGNISLKISNKIYNLLRTYGYDTVDQPRRFEQELILISDKLHSRLNYSKEDKNMFYLSFLEFAEKVRSMFFNMFIDSALGTYGLKFKLFDFLDGTCALDKRHLDQANVLITKIEGIRVMLDKEPDKRFRQDFLDILCYVSAFHTLPVHTAYIEEELKDMGRLTRLLNLTAEEVNRLNALKSRIVSLREEAKSLRRKLFSICRPNEVTGLLFSTYPQLSFNRMEYNYMKAMRSMTGINVKSKFPKDQSLGLDYDGKNNSVLLDDVLFNKTMKSKADSAQALYIKTLMELKGRMERHLAKE